MYTQCSYRTQIVSKLHHILGLCGTTELKETQAGYPLYNTCIIQMSCTL